MVVEAGLADLVEAGEGVEGDTVAVRHQQSMKNDGEAVLADVGNPAGFPNDLGPLGNNQMFPVVAPEVSGDHALDRTGEGTIEAIE